MMIAWDLVKHDGIVYICTAYPRLLRQTQQHYEKKTFSLSNFVEQLPQYAKKNESLNANSLKPKGKFEKRLRSRGFPDRPIARMTSITHDLTCIPQLRFCHMILLAREKALREILSSKNWKNIHLSFSFLELFKFFL